MTIAGVVYPAFLPQGYHLVFGELYDVDEETVQCLMNWKVILVNTIKIMSIIRFLWIF